MNDDKRLHQLLRSAFPPIGDRAPARDRWPQVVARGERPVAWTWIDLTVTAVIATMLLLFPEWVFVLAYHL